MSIKKRFGLVCLLTILIIPFQNCSVKKDDGALVLQPFDNTNLSQPGAVAPPPVVNLPPVVGTGIEAQAITLLQNKCFACHGTVASGGISGINDPAHLISVGQIIPGNPNGSPLYAAVSAGRMPLGTSLLTGTELKLLNDWITAGAKPPSGGIIVPPPVQIPLAGNYASVQANIITPKCIRCHSSTSASNGVRLDSYAAVKRYVSGSNPQNSKLYEITASGEMPPRPDTDLTAAELKALSDWIIAGAANN